MVFRYARHTQNLEKLIGFYTKVWTLKFLEILKTIMVMMVFFLASTMKTGIWNSLKIIIFRNLNLMKTIFWFSIQRLWKNFRTLLQIWNIIKFPSLNQKILTGKKTASASKIVTITKSLFLILESKIKTDVKRNFNLTF